MNPFRGGIPARHATLAVGSCRLRNSSSAPARCRALVAAILVAVCMGLSGCATLARTGTHPSPAGMSRHIPDLALLKVGMTVQEVRRLEPPPDKVIATSSQTMQVEEWEYAAGDGTVKLYFANGILQSWTR